MKEIVLHRQLIFLLNHYLQLYERGVRKEFHVEMVLCVMYMSIHHRADFKEMHDMCMIDCVNVS